MKKSFLTFSVITLSFLLVFQVLVIAKPICKKCWEKLNASVELKKLNLIKLKENGVYSVKMTGIRDVLEKVGINEKVMIELHFEKKLFGKIGSFNPIMKVMKGAGPKPKPDFSSMGKRQTFNIARGATYIIGDLGSKSKQKCCGHLVFKDALGKEGARLIVDLVVVDKGASHRK